MTRKELKTGDSVKYRYFINYYDSRDMKVKKGIFLKRENYSTNGVDTFYDLELKEGTSFPFLESLISCKILLVEKTISFKNKTTITH